MKSYLSFAWFTFFGAFGLWVCTGLWVTETPHELLAFCFGVR